MPIFYKMFKSANHVSVNANKSTDKMKEVILTTIMITLVSCSSTTSSKEDGNKSHDNGSNSVEEIHTRWGTPVDDTPDNDHIVIREQYVFSYDYEKNITNWVAWEISDYWYGDEPRYSGTFKPDPLIPDGWYKVRHDDYTHSGYDRGHLVRSEERTIDADDNFSTFYTTNILPMTPDLNRGPWLDLEYHLEDLAKANPDYKIQVYSGGIFTTDSTINGEGIVPVPDTLWKAVYIWYDEDEFISISSEPNIVAVKMPNIAGIRNEDWETYKVSVDDVEESTKYDLFYSIPDDIEEVLER